MTLFVNYGRYAYGLAGLLLFWRRKKISAGFRWLWPAFWVGSRVGGALPLFGMLPLPAPTDTADSCIVQAHGAMAGQLPRRDFDRSFAPLLPLVLAAFSAVWNSPYGFVVAAIVIEAVLLLVWRCFGPQLAPPETCELALAAYLCSALPFNAALMGQDEIGVGLVLPHRESWRGAAVGSGGMLLITKFTSVLYLPFLAWRSRHEWRFALIFALVALPCYLGLQQQGGADALMVFGYLGLAFILSWTSLRAARPAPPTSQ